MKAFEIFIRILAIIFRVLIEMAVAPMKGLRELVVLILDEAFLPLLGQTRTLIDQLETHGIQQSRNELPERKEQLPQ